jgi:copper(I)-binding protein
MNARHLIMGLIALCASSAAVASPPTCAPIVDQAWIRAAPPKAMALAGYARVRDACGREATIVGARSAAFGSVMLHATATANGMSTMREAGALRVPARGELRFAPGGNHIMLMQPRRALPRGQRVRIELLLSDGRAIAADFIVQEDAPPPSR